MKNHKHLAKTQRKFAALLAAWMLFAWPLGSCDLGQIDVSSSISINARDVLTGLIIGAIIDPIETAVITGVNDLFDEIEAKDD